MWTCAGLVVYAAGLVWLLLFPLVSLSTGELKPRSLYIDEHALLINSGTKYLYSHTSTANPAISAVRVNDIDDGSLCSVFHCQEIYMSNVTTQPITHIQLHTRHMETIVVSFIVSSNSSNHYITPIAKQIKDTKWIAKNILLLVIHQDCTIDKCGHHNNGLRYSAVMEQWFQQHYHNRFGLLRQNFIVDLTQINNASVSDTMTELLYVGIDGQLPNMDLVAAALAILPQHVVVDGRSKQYVNTHEKEHPLEYLRMSSLPHALQQVIPYLYQILSHFDGVFNAKDYFNRLIGLLEHLMASINGPSGIHSQFQLRNIDSLTLRYLNQSSYDMTNDIMKLVRVANNLHEELHHSHFYYLMMGHRHFVCITEFATNYLLLAMPILLACSLYCRAIQIEMAELKANGIAQVSQVLHQFALNLLAFFLHYHFLRQFPRSDFAVETVLFVVTQFNALRNTKQITKLTILRDKIYVLLCIAAYLVAITYGGVVHYSLMLPVVTLTSPIILLISQELMANRTWFVTAIAVVVAGLCNPMSTKYLLIHSGVMESHGSIHASSTVFLLCLVAYILFGLAFKVLFALHL